MFSEQPIQVTLTRQTLQNLFRFFNLLSFALVLASGIAFIDLRNEVDGIYLILLSLFLAYSDFVSNGFVKLNARFLSTLGGRGVTLLLVGLRVLFEKNIYYHIGPVVVILLLVASSFLIGAMFLPSFDLPDPIRLNLDIVSPTKYSQVSQDETTTIFEPELDLEAAVEK